MANRLLWADDEIELLNAHIIFLRNKGYEVDTVTNGLDAIEACKTTSFDLILLDENMPGLTGLETLSAIKEMHPATPVVMVTKSEEENIMEQAIGSKIADYLIKSQPDTADTEEEHTPKGNCNRAGKQCIPAEFRQACHADKRCTYNRRMERGL